MSIYTARQNKEYTHHSHRSEKPTGLLEQSRVMGLQQNIRDSKYLSRELGFSLWESGVVLF